MGEKDISRLLPVGTRVVAQEVPCALTAAMNQAELIAHRPI